MSIGDVTEEIREAFNLSEARGALVQSVDPGKPADKAGIRHGDVVVDVDGKPIRNNRELIDYISYLPVGTEVKFTVQSKDVIHDFWVPAFRMKIDAVPGIDTHLRVTPTRIGNYPVVCAELCGLGHSTMRQTAHVLAKDDFESWLSEERSKAAG
jgi:C-terminal processing protease CtpA/Prc